MFQQCSKELIKCQNTNEAVSFLERYSLRLAAVFVILFLVYLFIEFIFRIIWRWRHSRHTRTGANIERRNSDSSSSSSNSTAAATTMAADQPPISDQDTKTSSGGGVIWLS